MLSLACSTLALVLASSSSAPQGNVLVVGPGGIDQIQSAVNLAQDGDTILVRIPPQFRAFNAVQIINKSVTIVADSTSATPRIPSVVVRDVAAGKTVVLSRLDVQSSAPPPFVATGQIYTLHNAGDVRLLSCSSRGSRGNPMGAPGLAVEVSSGSTALAACELSGGAGIFAYDGEFDTGWPGGDGLRVIAARAAAFDSRMTGGDGGPHTEGFGYAGTGGAGASVASWEFGPLPTRLLLSNSTFQGGAGGPAIACSGYQFPGGDGGAGVSIGPNIGAGHEPITTTTLHACSFAGGPGGPAFGTCGHHGGSAGQPVQNFPGSEGGIVHTDPNSALRITAPSVAREHETVTLKFFGAPGDRVTLFAGQSTDFRELFGGILLVGGPTGPLRGSLGALDANGFLSVSFAAPELPPGVGAMNLWLQGLALHRNGKRTLGSFAVVTLLDSSL